MISLTLKAAIPVYKHPNSLHPSGFHNPKRLKASGETQKEMWLHVQVSANKSGQVALGWIPARYVISALDVSSKAKLHANTTVHSQPSLKEAPLFELKRKQVVTIKLNQSPNQADEWIKISYKKQTGFVKKEFLDPLVYDGGVAISRKALALKRYPRKKALTTERILPLTRMAILKIKGRWLKLKSHDGAPGWAPMDKLFTRLDFATKFVQKGRLRSVSLQRPLKSFKGIKGLYTQRNQLITWRPVSLVKAPGSREKVQARLKAFDKATLIKRYEVKWVKGRIPKRGYLWWMLPPKNKLENQKYSFEDLSKNEIFDLAASPQFSDLKFASANGVYRTFDNKNWEKLEFFEDENHPIAISQSGHIFVGPFKSEDQGKTFQPYVRWDNLVKNLIQAQNQVPYLLRLSDVEFVKNKDKKEVLRITVAAGRKQPKYLSFVSPDEGRSWTFDSPQK